MSDPNQDFGNNQRILTQESIENVNSSGNCNSYFHSPCYSCGCSNKRHSPDSPVLPAENPKKPYQKPIATLPDFSKFTLASPESNQDSRIQSPSSPPILRRCFSDPCKPPGSQIPVTQSPPESDKIASLTTPVSKASASLPPRPPLRRCLSDSSEYESFWGNSSSKEMSIDQWKKRIEGCMKEVDLCLKELMTDNKEKKEQDKGNEDNFVVHNEEASLVTYSEETVSVERNGGCITVHFKCSCGKGMDMLLCGNGCYYKLL